MSIWQFREAPAEKAPLKWAEELAITPLLLEILWRRGWRDYEAIDAYLAARLSDLTRPEYWPNIPRAAELIADTLLAGKKLAVWGDYDVDGITATTLVLDVLEAHGFEAVHHLPDRRAEGYGLNIPGIEALSAEGCALLLTVDCGIGDSAAVARARELGMTVIISDHHLPQEALPAADIIVDPRMAGNWPCPHLAGVGVAFYLMAAVNSLLSAKTGKRYKMDHALDLVGLGTLADVMRLEGENRILVRGGLNHMGDACRPGIAALKAVSGFDLAAELNSDQAVFRLAPRINAAGRMGDPSLALNLLRAHDFVEAETLATELDSCNRERKAQEQKMYAEASSQARELLSDRDYAGLVLHGADWHPGIVGIVASRIVEAFNKPAVVLYSDGDSLKGSCRSVPDFDLHAALSGISCLLGFGGHRLAAGVRLEKARLDEFRMAFHETVAQSLGTTPSEPVLVLEGELDFRRASNHKFLRELELMQPFGPGNPEPVFASPPLLVRRRSPLGHTQEHVLLEVLDKTSNVTLFARAWRMAEQIPASIVNRQIRLAYTPRLDIYNGIPRIDLSVKDWQPVRTDGI